MKQLLLSIGVALSTFCMAQESTENYRPRLHFAPARNWMNDPNGMVYYGGIYHFFFQYHPNSSKWGPMHWGHAESKDLINWTEKQVALYPDSLGYIFSGSIVVDSNNTSGFGTQTQVPLVAVFTQHDPHREQQKRNDFQYQSIAYSLDSGNTWVSYEGNPVLPNPGITDFRDPKVSWNESMKHWVMTLATKDRISFYTSPDLKTWTKASEFGEALGAHGGVWECPDLFPILYNGKTYWVLLVSLNPGAANGGSGTQYFIGDFDGRKFKPLDSLVRWMDYGTDNYAGVTFANTGMRKILMGWMNNWQYAQEVPTHPWRGAATLPRELVLKQHADGFILCSQPVPELNKWRLSSVRLKGKRNRFSANILAAPHRLSFKHTATKPFSLTLANSVGDSAYIGFDPEKNQFYIDRRKSGKTSFEQGFGKMIIAPRLSRDTNLNFTVYIDASSVELFADEGRTVMTCLLFPKEYWNQLTISSSAKMRNLEFSELR